MEFDVLMPTLRLGVPRAATAVQKWRQGQALATLMFCHPQLWLSFSSLPPVVLRWLPHLQNSCLHIRQEEEERGRKQRSQVFPKTLSLYFFGRAVSLGHSEL